MSSESRVGPRAQIEHIALVTCDLERLCDFYRQLGAIAVPLPAALETGPRSCVLDFSGVRLEVFEQQESRDDTAREARSPGVAHLAFALESADAVDELTDAVAAAGHRVLEPPHRDGELGRYASVVLDPDGNRLKLLV